jgi:hypothetical protein
MRRTVAASGSMRGGDDVLEQLNASPLVRVIVNYS